MKLNKLFNNPIYLTFQSLIAIIVGIYFELSKLQQSLMFITLYLLNLLFKRFFFSEKKNNYDPKIFALIESKETKKFTEYIEEKFKDIKELENIIYYVIYRLIF